MTAVNGVATFSGLTLNQATSCAYLYVRPAAASSAYTSTFRRDPRGGDAT